MRLGSSLRLLGGRILVGLVGFSVFQLQASATFLPTGPGCGGSCSSTQACQGECGCCTYPDGQARCIDALN